MKIKKGIISYYSRISTNPRTAFSLENRIITSIIIFILLILCVGAVFALTGKNKPKEIQEKIVEVQKQASPSATIAPTATPTALVNQTVKTSITATPTVNPNTASFHVRVLNYPDHNPIADTTKIAIRGALYTKEIDDVREITFSDIPPGDYTVEVNTPSGYRPVQSSDCGLSDKCRAVGDNCSRSFTIKAGEHGDFYCSYQKYDTSSSSNNGKPEFSISYPSEGQNITFTSPDQQFCVVTIPGANTGGAVIYYNYNNTDWTTSCFVPQEGTNTVQVKIKNSDNVESDIQTRTFIFHKGF